MVPDDIKLRELLEELQSLYANRGVHLVHHEERWTFRTAADLAPRMKMERKVSRRLSRAAVEMLAIVAYHQPVTRAEIEEIRGVMLSRGTLEALLEAGWIKPKGRRETPGRPVTWGTTDGFLEHFGLVVRPRQRKEPVLQPGDEHHGKFQSLRVVHGHERHAIRARVHPVEVREQ